MVYFAYGLCEPHGPHNALGLDTLKAHAIACRVARARGGIVAGAANNQLAEPRHGDDLMQRGILYAPDYAINAGGLINVACEIDGYDEQRVRARVTKIFDTIYEIADRAKKAMQPTYRIADTMAQERLAQATPRPSTVPQRSKA